jgi:hypothetical protein
VNGYLADFLYGIGRERTAGDLEFEQKQATLWDPLPPGFLAIGHDPGGSTLLLATLGQDAGRVYFWDRAGLWVLEDGHNTFPVAASFSEFVGSLHELADGEAGTENERGGRNGSRRSSAPRRPGTAKAETDCVFAEVYGVADQYPVVPIKQARLSRLLAELPNPRKVVQRVLAELVDHDNPSLRRIGIHACRQIGLFQAPGLRSALLSKLSDPVAWVRYDAAWAVKDAGYDGKDVRDLLALLAGDAKLPEDEQRLQMRPSDAELAARVQARAALDCLVAVTAGQPRS